MDKLILILTTNPLRQRPDRTQLLLLQLVCDVHPNPGPISKYPCPVCTRNVTSRVTDSSIQHSIGEVKIGSATLARPQQSSNHHHHHLQPLLHLPNRDNSTFDVLQLNADRTDRTGSSTGEKQGLSGGDTEVKALIKIQEPLHPELYQSA